MRIPILIRLAQAVRLQTLREEVLAGGSGAGEHRPNAGATFVATFPPTPPRRPGGTGGAVRRKARGKVFTALAMTGRLHLVDIEEGGPWDPFRIKFDNQAMANELRAHLGARRARSVDELDLYLQESAVRAGIIILCVDADLLEAARIRWAYGTAAAASTASQRAPLVG